MPHTNRKHVRSENQPSCTGCLTDQQVRKLTLILAKTPKTLRRRERNLTNSTGCNYLHPRRQRHFQSLAYYLSFHLLTPDCLHRNRLS